MNLPEECDENNREEDSVSWFLIFLYIFSFFFIICRKKTPAFYFEAPNIFLKDLYVSEREREILPLCNKLVR